MKTATYNKAILQAERQRRARSVQAIIAGRSLLDFTKFTFQPKYLVNWHHKLTSEEIDNWLNSKVPYNLMIMEPPRHGKSEQCARRLPGYAFGKRPDLDILFGSYNADLATDMSRDAQAVMLTPEYKLVFPKTRLGRSGRKKEDVVVSQAAEFDIVGKGGHYRAAGVGGSFTGRGASIGIIDDPIKGRKEAESPTIRKQCIDWYKSVFRTRLERDGRILMLLTRWHREDLAGWCIDKMKTDPKADRWKIISLPAIFEKTEYTHPKDPRKLGEALWPARFPLSFLERTKAVMGSYDWNALYQQRPDPPGGARFKRYWANIIDRNQLPAGLFWVRYWDLAVSSKKTADFTASGLMSVDEQLNIYVRGYIREQQEWPTINRLFKNVAIREGLPIGIEAQGVQKGFFQSLISDPDLGNVDIRAYDVEVDKLTRAQPWIARAEAGKFYCVREPGLDLYLDELERFTGQGDTHDDQVDWTSGAYKMLLEYQPAYVEEIGQYA